MSIIYKNILQKNANEYHSMINQIKDEEKYLFYTLRFSVESTSDYIKQHENNNCPIIGAFNNNHLVGWIDYNRGDFEEISHIATIGMGVIKEFRGKGIGTALLERCIKSAKENNIEKLELEVFKTNVNAFGLYKKLGFQKEGIRIKKRKYLDRYDDLIEMGLLL